jgi:hypothetical protein
LIAFKNASRMPALPWAIEGAGGQSDAPFTNVAVKQFPLVCLLWTAYNQEYSHSRRWSAGAASNLSAIKPNDRHYDATGAAN